MSTQKSVLPIHPTRNDHDHGNAPTSLDLDPFAAPNVYYGTSHGPRKVAKSRTYSAVGEDGMKRRWDSTDGTHQIEPGNDRLDRGSFQAPARRTSHGE
jgi:alpha,alpha-trehalase